MSLADLTPSIPRPVSPPRPAPLLPIAVGLCTGIVVDSHLVLPLWFAAALFVAGLLVATISKHHRAAFTIGCLAAAIVIGAARHALADRHLPADHLSRRVGRDSILTTIEGRVQTLPVVSTPDNPLAVAYEVGPRSRFVLRASTAAGPDRPITVSGLVAVVVQGEVRGLSLGDRVRLSGWLHRPRPPANPGQFDWALHGRRNGLHVAMSCKRAESVVVLERSRGAGWSGFLAAIRTRARGYLLDNAFDPDDPAAGVLAAMVLGQRSEVSKAINDTFIMTGNAHFLAASGTNVGWLAMLGWWVLMRGLGLHFRTTAVVIALLIAAFLLVAEPQPSILRAGVIGLLACWSLFRRGSLLHVNWLAASAILILMIDPTDIFRPAFQFSYLAVLAIMLLEPALARGFARFAVGRGWFLIARQFDKAHEVYGLTLLDSPPQTQEWTWRDRLAALLPLRVGTMSCAAWLIVTPLSCYYFNLFTPWGWLGTLAIWFIIIPVTWLGFISVLAGVLLPPVAKLLAPLLAGSTHLLVTWVALLARIPGTLIEGRSPSLLWVCCVYALLAAWLLRPRLLPYRHAFKTLALVLCIIWLVPPRWFRHDPRALEVWALAVGHGTATFIELPNGQVWAYDLGTRSPFDAAPLCANFLRARGIARLDKLFVSHPDFDHYGAIEGLAKTVPIGELLINDHFEPLARDGRAAKFLASMRNAGVPIRVIEGARTFEAGDVRADVLWPPTACRWNAPDANDSSSVMRLSYQGRSVLLTGDIADVAQGRLLDREGIQSDALMLPHHGAVVAPTPRFIEAVAPRVCIRSTGERRVMTAPELRAIVRDHDYYSTADDGCVRVTIRDGRLSTSAWLRRDR